ncbi:MAG: hypothetical protein M1823_008531, partial [Watsoniomyces obsoletus]
SNRLELFRRLPSDLRRYRHYIYNLNRYYGSVLAFVQQERLHWKDAVPSSDPPYRNPEDYRILYSDWPYGVERDVQHLVVWTKYLLEEDEETGDLTTQARACIEAFVKRTFCGEDGVPRDQLVWFRNWKSLKSVHAL